MRMLLKSLRALCKASSGAERFWKYYKEVTRVVGVCGRLDFTLGTELHCSDVPEPQLCLVIQDMTKHTGPYFRETTMASRSILQSII